MPQDGTHKHAPDPNPPAPIAQQRAGLRQPLPRRLVRDNRGEIPPVAGAPGSTRGMLSRPA